MLLPLVCSLRLPRWPLSSLCPSLALLLPVLLLVSELVLVVVVVVAVLVLVGLRLEFLLERLLEVLPEVLLEVWPEVLLEFWPEFWPEFLLEFLLELLSEALLDPEPVLVRLRLLASLGVLLLLFWTGSAWPLDLPAPAWLPPLTLPLAFLGLPSLWVLPETRPLM